MHVDERTQVCISIAARPGRIGTALHNAGYRALGLNFIYKAFGVSDLASALAGVRALGIRGVSVSMPFKSDIIGHLDECDPLARSIGAVNTVVNDSGRLVGYNTDVEGAGRALEELGCVKGRSVLVLGAGGAARAVVAAIAMREPAAVWIAARTAQRAAPIAQSASATVVPWEDRHRVAADFVINATPVGMAPDVDVTAFDLDRSAASPCVMDVVIAPLESRLLREARAAGLRVAPGYRMAMFQAAAQFELYTGRSAPLPIFEQTLLALVSSAA